MPLTLTLRGGFAVLDSQQRRLHRHAHAQGYSDLGSYLLARAQQQASPAQLARELGTTTTVVRRLLDTAGVTPSPRQVTAAADAAAVPTSTWRPAPRRWASHRCGHTLPTGRSPGDGQPP